MKTTTANLINKPIAQSVDTEVKLVVVVAKSHPNTYPKSSHITQDMTNISETMLNRIFKFDSSNSIFP